MRKLPLILLLFFPLSVWGSFSSLGDVFSRCAAQKLQPVLIKDERKQNWDAFADLLYWHVGEVGTIPNSTISTKLDPDLVSKLNLNNLNFGWDFGGRIGARYRNIGEDEWGIFLSYTWFRSKAKTEDLTMDL